MQKYQHLIVATLVASCILPLAQAATNQPQDDRWYIAPFASYLNTGGDRQARDGWGGGLGVGKIIDEHFNVELKGFYQGFNGNNGSWDLVGASAECNITFFVTSSRLMPWSVSVV